MPPSPSAGLSAQLNAETARIAWRDLQRFFAAGKVIYVAPDLDLVEVASCIAGDDSTQLTAWLNAGQVAPVSDHQAREWHAANALVWSVVVKPWVLAQPILVTSSSAAP